MATNSINGQKTIQDIIDRTSKSVSDRKTGELGKDDFLNLLVTQLKFQDPLKPVDDKEFIGQMAQFSALEQMQNMNVTFNSVKGFDMIGKRVTASIVDEVTRESKVIEGDVSNVKITKGKTYVVVKGEDIPVESVTDVTESIRSSNASNISSYTGLIGYNVKGLVYDARTSNFVDVSGIVKAIEKGQYEDYAVTDGVSVEISDIVSDTYSTNPDFRKRYLENNKGKEVEVVIVNRETGQKVPVAAVLRDFKIAPDGKITATLDEMNIPVESIMKITPGPKEAKSDTEPVDEGL